MGSSLWLVVDGWCVLVTLYVEQQLPGNSIHSKHKLQANHKQQTPNDFPHTPNKLLDHGFLRGTRCCASSVQLHY